MADVEKHSSCLPGMWDLNAGLGLRWNRRWIAALLWASYWSSHCQAWASLSTKSLVRLLHVGQRWCINSARKIFMRLWCDSRVVFLQKMVFCWTRLLWKKNQVQEERTVSSHHHFCDKLLWKEQDFCCGVSWKRLILCLPPFWAVTLSLTCLVV